MKKPNKLDDENKVKLIVFYSGKVNLTNAKTVEEVNESYKYFFEEILVKNSLLTSRSSSVENSTKKKKSSKNHDR